MTTSVAFVGAGNVSGRHLSALEDRDVDAVETPELTWAVDEALETGEPVAVDGDG